MFSWLVTIHFWWIRRRVNEGWLTRTTTSLAARARISEHETRPGQWASTASLALATVSNPSPARDILSWASFSASPLSDAINTEASHPYTVTNHMKTRITILKKLQDHNKAYIHQRNSRERTSVMFLEPWWVFVGTSL